MQVDQAGQAIQDVLELVSGERFGVVNLEGSTNDGQPSQKVLLARREQLVGPADGGAQVLMSGRRVASR